VGSLSKENLEVIADWMLLAGALLLFGSLFLTWSHQISPTLGAMFGTADALQGVPANPTAWQVYSAADVLLAALAAGLLGVAMYGTRTLRMVALGFGFVGLVFVIHAIASPPTNGVGNLFNPANSMPQYLPIDPGAGLGETLALFGLLGAIAGLVISFAADEPEPAPAADRGLQPLAG
jgi:hypothetical protein